MNKAQRLERLLPGGVPRYVRCYDAGESGDRYTVVFTGNYTSKTGGESVYLGMSASPYHPQGVGMHGQSRGPIDRPTYGHLGKRIKFEDLPEDCKKLVISDYKELWDLEVQHGDGIQSGVL